MLAVRAERIVKFIKVVSVVSGRLCEPVNASGTLGFGAMAQDDVAHRQPVSKPQSNRLADSLAGRIDGAALVKNFGKLGAETSKKFLSGNFLCEVGESRTVMEEQCLRCNIYAEATRGRKEIRSREARHRNVVPFARLK